MNDRTLASSGAQSILYVVAYEALQQLSSADRATQVLASILILSAMWMRFQLLKMEGKTA